MDRREQNQQWYHHFDAQRMVIVLLEDGYLESDDQINEVPAKLVVCGTCEGTGKHVNPSIDSHGLSREDFDEDPDFAEAYFSGAYDVQCNECHGRNVVPDVDESRATSEQLAAVNDLLDSRHREAVERDYERRMGY